MDALSIGGDIIDSGGRKLQLPSRHAPEPAAPPFASYFPFPPRNADKDPVAAPLPLAANQRPLALNGIPNSLRRRQPRDG